MAIDKRVVLVAALAAVPLMASEPAGYVRWSAAELQGYGAKLRPKMNAGKVGVEQLAKWGNHSAMIAHREGDGESEVHDTQADVFFVQAGEATLVIGGEVEGGRTTAPGETRGASIQGGRKQALGAGDVVHIPAKVPHQLLIAPGKVFTYFVVKVDTP
jgi:mannose-6-phosphate isomerase-like protein (cupin superfamily)